MTDQPIIQPTATVSKKKWRCCVCGEEAYGPLSHRCGAPTKLQSISKRLVVYVAGPLGSGPNIGENVGRAIDAGKALVLAGYAPIVPHFSAYYPDAFSTPYGTWIDVCLAQVARCDILVRLPGESPGSDKEVAEAQRLGIRVATMEELVG